MRPPHAPRASLLLLAPLAIGLAPDRAEAQLGGTVPPPSFGLGVEALYRGDYRRAQRSFASDLRGAVRIGQVRWIDSICYHAMLGETLFRQGRNAEALDQFDRACGLIVANPDWLRRVKFDQPLRADPAAGRRRAPWGPGVRRPTYAGLPDTFLVGFGRLNNVQQAEQGGVVQAPQLWRVDAVQVARCSALAIRRRNDLLGALGPTDSLSKQLADTLGRGDLAPAGHWSQAWVSLLRGLAELGIGQQAQALNSLRVAVTLEGRFDHPLTGAALLAQAGLAQQAGDAAAAGALHLDAGLAGFAYEDLDVVSDALERGAALHAATRAGGVYPPLEPALRWSRVVNAHHVTFLARTLIAEHRLLAGQGTTAAMTARPTSREREAAAGRLGLLRNRMLATATGIADTTEAPAAGMQQALEQQAKMSLTNFQILLTGARLDDGVLSPRLAVGVYGQLLDDPDRMSWLFDPLEVIAVVRTAHDDAYDRWFLAALGRDEPLEALRIGDLAKRRRFLRSQPLGGRRLALRRLANAAPDALDKQAAATQRELFAAQPELKAALDGVTEATAKLVAAQPVVEGGRLSREAARLMGALADQSDAAEAALGKAAWSRLPTRLTYPPVFSPADAQQRLRPGDAVLVFHQAAGAMHGFLIVAGGQHHWRLATPPDRLAGAVAETLRQLGNYGAGRTLRADEVAGPGWRRAVAQLGAVLLGDSRLDVGTLKRLVIVPDGVLWHVPFEALPMRGAKGATRPIIDAAPVRYAPTCGLALSPAPPLRPVVWTGLVLPTPTGGTLERDGTQRQQERLVAGLQRAVRLGGATAPAPLLAAALDQLVVATDQTLPVGAGGDWAPVRLGRAAPGARLLEWLRLPAAGPRSLVLSGVGTAAEQGLKPSRRVRNAVATQPGEELFQAACGLLGAGPQTVLLSRWRTGGAVGAEMVREFATQAGSQGAADAWRRSVSLVRGVPLDPELEPRLEWDERDGDPPTAEHPFFWAGYLLLDTGGEPPAKPKQPDAEAADPGVGAAAAAGDPAPDAADRPSQPDGVRPADPPPAPGAGG